MTADLNSYVEEIRGCRLCADDMPHAPNPVLQISETARIFVAGQAPGNLAHTSGKPFDDPSGVRLRGWMGVSDNEFYDASKVAIAPMGFCFPGYDNKGGDLPPIKRCAEVWRAGLLERLPNIEVTLLVGGYSQDWHLPEAKKLSLTDRVKNWRDFAKNDVFTMPHPSWRNNGWLKRNPWFENEVLPVLRASVRRCLEA